MGGNKINQQSKCVLKQVQTALMNDENNDIVFKATNLYNDLSYRNSNTSHWAWMVAKSSLNKISFIGIYAYDLVRFLVFVCIFICKFFLKNFPVCFILKTWNYFIFLKESESHVS